MEEGEYTVLDAIRDITQTDRAFFNVIRFLDGNTRNHIVAAHMRNTSQMTSLLRLFMTSPQQANRVENIVMNIPLNSILDPSGNFLRSFLDPVAVIPTAGQIRAGTQILTVAPPDTTCSICQEDITGVHTCIRHCNHPFHSECIREWFTMNTRCPVCRHDVRVGGLRHDNDTTNNDNRMHADEE